MRLTLVDKPERTQSQILIGQPAPRWQDPDFLALQVATTAFGGTFTARLMDEVRSKRGLSYGASARVGQGRGAKSLVAHVFPSLEQTPETLELVLRLWRDWVDDGVTDARGRASRAAIWPRASPSAWPRPKIASSCAPRSSWRACRATSPTPSPRASTKVERADAVRALPRT